MVKLGMVSGNEIREKYLNFFEKRGHKIVPSAPLVPENDPTTLFTGSGMQPMIPYLLGQTHPQGIRLVDSQKCFRAQDIEEVGDNRHDTFFEMLGNWSLGDYFKEEQITWFYEFLTSMIGLNPDRLWVSVFAGDKIIPKDTEAENIWLKIGVPKNRIFFYDEKKNWWSRAGIKSNMPVGEPGGPDSEVFYDFGTPHDPEFGAECHPNCDCGRFLEIGNSVFMTYKKTEQGFVPLEKKNIDFGGGLERLTAVANHDPDIFKTDLFEPIINKISEISNVEYGKNDKSDREMRIIADHVKAATMLIADGVLPTNKAQGYVLRRLIRRAEVKMKFLRNNMNEHLQPQLSTVVLNIYKKYFNYKDHVFSDVYRVFEGEILKFMKTSFEGLKILYKASKIDEKLVFDLFQTYGFQPEVTEELLKQRGISINWSDFNRFMSDHQQLSRTASKGMFKGGLQDHSEVTTKYHTATHLLHAALRKVLGNHVQQKGSNITAERLRFDFSHPEKMTEKQLKDVEELTNKKIAENITVTKTEMKKSEALSAGALAFFPEKYPEVTNVYKIGDFSMELCGGPHVTSTGLIGKIKITKEESAGANVRRIYAQLD